MCPDLSYMHAATILIFQHWIPFSPWEAGGKFSLLPWLQGFLKVGKVGETQAQIWPSKGFTRVWGPWIRDEHSFSLITYNREPIIPHSSAAPKELHSLERHQTEHLQPINANTSISIWICRGWPCSSLGEESRYCKWSKLVQCRLELKSSSTPSQSVCWTGPCIVGSVESTYGLSFFWSEMIFYSISFER